MARPDKAAAVAELTTAFRESSAAVLTEYRGLTVAELKELRRSLAGNATYLVVKNTLSKIAAREAGVTAFEDMLVGPSAIAFVSGDAVTVAKSLRDFGKEHPHLVVKGGVLDGAPLTADEIKKLADLESREVLLAKLAGGFVAPATQLASVLMAPVRQLAQGGTTVLLTTQYLDEAEQLADRIAILHRGTIIQKGTLAELKALLPPAQVEYVEKQPSLEDVFLSLVGETDEDPTTPTTAEGTQPAGEELR